jgi:uncharacterized protein
LDEAFIDYCDSQDILLAMSFDGVREAHDAHRRLRSGASSFDLLLGKLRLLLKARPFASVLMVVTPESAPHLEESVSFLLDEGCRYLIISMNYAAPWSRGDFKVLRRQYKALARRYVEWTRGGRKFYLSPFETKLSSHINRHCYRKERCELAQRQLSIDPDGVLYPCVQFVAAGPESRFNLGNVFDGVDWSRRDALRDESEREKSTCQGCAAQQRCHNTCGCLNWQTTGTVAAVSPVLGEYERLLIEVSDQIGQKLYKGRDASFLHKHYNDGYAMLSPLEELQPVKDEV